MRPREKGELKRLEHLLGEFCAQVDAPGLEDPAAISSLARQLIESRRRIEFVAIVDSRSIAQQRADPASSAFDPIRAAILFKRQGDIDEAAWLVFLSTHFGHHLKDHWTLVRDVYGGLSKEIWTWHRVSTDVAAFRLWLDVNQGTLRGGDGVKRRFGNHRKYTSLDAWKSNATGDAVSSYVSWVTSFGSHSAMFQTALDQAEGDGTLAFDELYGSMSAVASFGRIGRFDYLTMIGKTRIAPISPRGPYLSGSTGPLQGAKLLFGGGKSTSVYESLGILLGNRIGYDMQMIEDAICNWQKSPLEFIPFRG